MQIDAVRLVWTVKGVREVKDDIKVGHPETFSDYMRDAWMTSKLKWALVMDERVGSINYSLRTVDRVIYLMGVAQNQKELDIVLQHAYEIPNVKNIVNYVVLKENLKNIKTDPSAPPQLEPMDNSEDVTPPSASSKVKVAPLTQQ
jgi:osmotically-inducible protein OsmY